MMKKLKILGLSLIIAIGTILGINVDHQKQELYDLLSEDNYIVESGQVLNNNITTGKILSEDD